MRSREPRQRPWWLSASSVSTRRLAAESGRRADTPNRRPEHLAAQPGRWTSASSPWPTPGHRPCPLWWAPHCQLSTAPTTRTANQLATLKSVAAANPNVVVVLVNGSTVILGDVVPHAGALVEAWLGGQAAGGAIADGHSLIPDWPSARRQSDHDLLPPAARRCAPAAYRGPRLRRMPTTQRIEQLHAGPHLGAGSRTGRDVDRWGEAADLPGAKASKAVRRRSPGPPTWRGFLIGDRLPAQAGHPAAYVTMAPAHSLGPSGSPRCLLDTWTCAPRTVSSLLPSLAWRDCALRAIGVLGTHTPYAALPA